MQKKRSQSSYRSKTQQSEDGSTNQNYWIGNVQAKKVLNKVNEKITSSMVEQNKENSSLNLPIYQSVTEFGYIQDEKSESSLIVSLQEKCKKYERELTQFYEGKNHQKMYNYADQFYEGQIQELKEEIGDKNRELAKYQNLYESKIEELDDVNIQISSRIEKNQTEKNLYIKELNVKNIEIKKLKEALQLYRSQKEHLNMFIKEQHLTIEDLTHKVAQIQSFKKKSQTYEEQLRASQSNYEEIENQLQKILEETRNKDKTIQENSKIIIELSENTDIYEQEIKKLEEEMLILKENKYQKSQQYQEKVKECEELKEQFYDVRKQLQMVPQFQIKLKNSFSTIDDLRARNKELIATNQKLKIDLNNYKSLQSKVTQIQTQNTLLRKTLREKEELISQNQNKQLNLSKMEEQLLNSRSKQKQAEIKISQREKQIRMLTNSLNEKDLALKKLTNELTEYKQENLKLKEQRKKQLQSLFIDNKSMRESLLIKIDEIEDLQRKLTNIESKNISLLNENKKYKAIVEGREQEINDLSSKLQTIKNRWQTQMGARIGLEQRCARLNQQIFNHQAKIQHLEQVNASLSKASEDMIKQFQTKKEQLCQQLKQMNQYRVQAQENLLLSSNKIQQMQSSIKILREEVEELTEQENSHRRRIKELEHRIIELSEKLEKANREISQMRRMWAQINEVSARMMRCGDN